jgi:hypothetical protein
LPLTAGAAKQTARRRHFGYLEDGATGEVDAFACGATA